MVRTHAIDGARCRAFAALVIAAGVRRGRTSHRARRHRAPVGAACGAHRRSRAPATATTPAAPRPRIVFLGDSLTAGYGLARDQSVPSLIAARLTGMGLDYEVVNAGVSGDTSAGGLSRLDWSLDGTVRVLVVELGANDGLRGLPVDGHARQPGRHHPAGARPWHSRGADRHGGAAQLRPGLHQRVSRRLSRPGRQARAWPSSRSTSRAWPGTRASTSPTASIRTRKGPGSSNRPSGGRSQPLLTETE